MHKNFRPSSSAQRLHELVLMRDILVKAHTLVDKHGLLTA